jgi:hypothetical protein
MRVMNETPLYTYRLSGRRPMTVVVLCFSVAMLAFVAQHAASWYFLVPVLLSGAMALWAIIANPQTGATLDAETLHFFSQGTEETVQIADIASMKVSRWSDGPDTVALTLKSGDIVHVPSLCADSRLAVMLKDLGIVEAAQ